jgi:metal-responsive CopG/Arc/MetJ family transcriptional regulator
MYVQTNGQNMLEIKERKDKRMEIRLKPSILEKLNKIRDLYRVSQSELIEELIKKVYAEHQKNGKIK